MSDTRASVIPPYRIGHGYDVHRFGEGDGIVLGGIKIPHNQRFIAHSDGDVLIHALCDAMIGSIAAGDIGQHFPDTDERYKDIDSTILLKETSTLLEENHYSLSNADITIVAQAPRMSAYIMPMRERLSSVLDVDVTSINIKATTTEQLGFTGREEGIAVHCVVMVYKNNT